MASSGAVLRGAARIPGGARPTPAPQGSGAFISGNSGLSLNGPSIGQISPMAASLANEGGYARAYGGFLPRPPQSFTQGAFSPFSPILPVPVDEPPDGALRPDPRRYEYQVGWNLPVGQPGTEGLKLASFSTMQRLADVYSVCRACIEYRKNQVRGIEWDIIPTPDAAKAYQGSPSKLADFAKRRVQAVKFFTRPDRNYLTYSLWLSSLLEEVLVYDALSLMIVPTWGKGRGKGLLNSDLDSLMLIHGSTIRPLIDLHGGTPRPPAPAYQQYLYGVPRSDYLTLMTNGDIEDAGMKGSQVAQFRGDQLIYMPMVPRAWTPYGLSAIERALIPIMTGLQKQGYQYDFFSESTVPSAYIIPGDTAMTPNQLRELQDALNAIAGDPAWKQKIIVLPPNSKVEPQRPVVPADELDELITQQVCQAFGLSPMEIGVTPGRSSSSSSGAANQMAKMTKDNSEDTGLTPILKYLADLFNLIISEVCGQTDMLFTYEGLQQEEDQDSLTGVLVQQFQNGMRTLDECRQELNLQPYGLEESSEPIITTPQGPTPLSVAVQNAQNAAATSQAQVQQAHAGTAATQAGTEATQARTQISQESHEVRMAQPPPGLMSDAQVQQHQQLQEQDRQGQQSQNAPTGAAGAEGKAESGKPSSSQSDRPVQAAAQAATSQAGQGSGRTESSTLKKRADAELSALARHISKGRSVSSWEPRFITQLHLADVSKLIATGLAPEEAAEVVKAQPDPKGGSWPGWLHDKAVASHYQGLIVTAFKNAMGAVRELLAKFFSGEIRVTPAWVAQEVSGIISTALKRVMSSLWTEGYALGQQSAKHLIATEASSIDWGSWQPGDPESAALIATGSGLQQLLQQWGVNVIQSVSETNLDSLAQQVSQGIKDGESAGTVANRIEELLNVPMRAPMIAQTEVTRAVSAGAVNRYKESGVERKQWLVAPDERVCPVCLGNEADGSIPLSQAFSSGVDAPGAHPRCRCSVIPASVAGFDLSSMVAEPLPGFNSVPLRQPALVKVGKEGYIHGWIFVGKPGVTPDDEDKLKGTVVHHPELGDGHITGTTEVGIDDKGRHEDDPGFDIDHSEGIPAVTADFSGKKRAFEMRSPSNDPYGFMDPAGLGEDPLVSAAGGNDGLYRRNSEPDITAPASASRVSRAMGDYISPRGNDMINSGLRDGSITGDDPRGYVSGKQGALRRDVAAIDKAIAAHKLKNDVDVFRGIALTPSLERKMTLGATFTDPAYTSVSSVPEWAKKFAEARVTGQLGTGSTVRALGGKPVIMRIHVPKGTHAALGQSNLGEYVLPRGTRYKVNSVQDGLMDVSVVP